MTQTLPIISTGADGRLYADSREIAQHFGKEHRNVLQAIDNLVAEAPETLRNFQHGSYRLPNTGSQDHRLYLLDRDGFSLLVMGACPRADNFTALCRQPGNRPALRNLSNPSIGASQFDADKKMTLSLTEGHSRRWPHTATSGFGVWVWGCGGAPTPPTPISASSP
jgi:Rha family phage regulatory protein